MNYRAWSRRWLRNFIGGMAWIGMIGQLVMMLFVTYSVIARYFFNHPIVGDYEFSMLLLITTVVTGFALVQEQGRNIRVDVFFDKFPSAVRSSIDILSNLAMAALCGMATWGLIGLYGRTLKTAPVTEGMDVPIAPFILLMCVGVGATSLQFLVSTFGGNQRPHSDTPNHITAD